MTRNEFFQELESALAGLPRSEIDRISEYYDEIISEALEEGKTEEDICGSLDRPEDIAGRVRAEIAFVRAEQQPSAKSMSTVLIILLGIFALPIGLPVTLAVFSVILSIAVSVFAVVVSLGAAVFGIFAGGLVGIVYGLVLLIQGAPLFGIALTGASFVLVGISIFGGFAVYHIFRLLFRCIAKCSRALYNWVVNKSKRRRNQI